MAPGAAKRILLIDGTSLLYRAYFALPALSTAGGTPTHAVYGFARMVLRLLDDVRPEYAAVAFDRPAPTFRHEAYEEYKATRPKAPSDLLAQIPLAKEFSEALNIRVVEIDGYEADDVVGTLARMAEERGLEALVVTGDKDALQLVTDRVRALVTHGGVRKVELYDPERVEREIGVAPGQIADLKGLAGDKSDNIPGVPGIGPKTAARLLREYGTLDRLLGRADRVSGKAGEALRAHRAQAEMSKRLARIDREAPVAVDLEELRLRDPDRSRLEELCRRLEFHSLLASGGPGIARGPGRPRDAGGERAPSFRVLEDYEAVRRAFERACAGDDLYIDFVWQGAHPAFGDLVGLGALLGGSTYYVHLASLSREERARILLGPVAGALSRAGVVCCDAKALMLLLPPARSEAIQVRDDVMLLGYLCAPGQGDASLEALAGAWGVEEKEGIDALKLPPPAASGEEIGRRIARRIDAVRRLRSALSKRVEEEGLANVYRNVELPLAPVLAAMERTGIRLDTRLLKELSAEFGRRLAELESAIFAVAGEEFNLNSPKQLASVLFERLGLPVLAKTKTGPSTSAEVLEALSGEHEIAARILEHRQLQKLKSAYADALPGLIRPETGRVHTTFNQAVAATGRLSSANPNLQNIPVRTEEGRRIRRAFVAGEGCVLLKADYSQIELRILAHLARDAGLIEAFRQGADIHAETAAAIFGVRPDGVTREQREAAKAINYGIVYGMSSYGLSRGTGLSREDAGRFIDQYFERYPGVARYMKEIVESARREGFVATLLGRKRYLPEIRSRSWRLRSFAERAAINAPVQGSAADIIKAAMIAVHDRLVRERAPAALLLQVHDELVLECERGAVRDVARLVAEEMEGAAALLVPLKVDVSAGANWLDVKPVSIDGGSGHA